MKTISDIFRENLARNAAIRSINTYDLADKSGVNFSHIYRLTSGERKNPRIETVEALAKGLGVSLEDLLKPQEQVLTASEWQAIQGGLELMIDASDRVIKDMRNKKADQSHIGREMGVSQAARSALQKISLQKG